MTHSGISGAQGKMLWSRELCGSMVGRYTEPSQRACMNINIGMMRSDLVHFILIQICYVCFVITNGSIRLSLYRTNADPLPYCLFNTMKKWNNFFEV